MGTGLSSSESDSSGAGGGDDDLESEQEGSDFKRQRRFEPTPAAFPPPSPLGTHSTGRNATSNNPLRSVARHINNNAEFDRQNVNYLTVPLPGSGGSSLFLDAITFFLEIFKLFCTNELYILT
jgi:hypothetical protein